MEGAGATSRPSAGHGCRAEAPKKSQNGKKPGSVSTKPAEHYWGPCRTPDFLSPNLPALGCWNRRAASRARGGPKPAVLCVQACLLLYAVQHTSSQPDAYKVGGSAPRGRSLRVMCGCRSSGPGSSLQLQFKAPEVLT